MNKIIETVAVVGLGYVGLPLAVLAANKGYKVIGIDSNSEKVKTIKNKVLPFKDKQLLSEFKKAKIMATTDFQTIEKANIVIICVPTPVFENRLPNYGPVKVACKSIAPYLKKNTLVILESTVNPGVSEEIVVPVLEKFSKLKAGEFLLAHCPERINPGDPKWNVSNIARVVGGLDTKSLNKAYRFYKSIISAPIKKMSSLKEAEACKVVENSFRNVNIAFVNELAQSFSRLGIDVVNVIEGASTKPFAFMPHYPGVGIGGHCIPVDPYYLIDYAKKNGYSHRFLSLACKVNEEMPQYTVSLLKKELKKKGIKLKGANIAMLGLSYKADIDDTRESPAFVVKKHLINEGANVRAYDPYVKNGSGIKNAEDAIKNAHAVLVTTNHTEFKNLDPEMLKRHGVQILIDGKNCLEKDKFINAGLSYKGIGR